MGDASTTAGTSGVQSTKRTQCALPGSSGTGSLVSSARGALLDALVTVTCVDIL